MLALGNSLVGNAPLFDPLSLSPLVYFDALGGSMLDSGGAAASHGDNVAVLDDLAESSVALVLPGTSGNYASLTKYVPTDGVFRVEVGLLADDYTPAANEALAGVWLPTGDERSWLFRNDTTGALVFSRTTDGTGGTLASATSSVVVPDQTRYVALEWDIDGGTVDFETSSDGVSWSALGSQQSLSTAPFDATSDLEIGAAAAGVNDPFSGSIQSVILKQDGTAVRSIDFTTPAAGATSFTASTGQTVTINQSGDYPARIGGTSYAAQSTDSLRPVALTERGLYLPGVSGNYASVPDDAALDITGEITVEIQVKLPAYLGTHFFYQKGLSYYFMLSSNDCRFNYGGVNVVGSSPSVSAGDLIWLRARCNPDTGGGNYEVVFEQSTDGETWSNISTETGSGMSPAAVNDPLNIGSNTSSVHLTGTIKRTRIFASTDGTDKRLDIDFTNPSDAHGATSITAETGQTVTINQSGDDPATLLRYPVARFDGSDDYLSGTFGSTLTGGWMFAVFEVLGSGGESNGRLFSMAAMGSLDFADADSLMFLRKNSTSTTNSNVRIQNGNYLSRTDGLVGRQIAETRTESDTIYSLKNGANELSGSVDLSGLASDIFAIGGAAGSGADNLAIDLHHLSLYPATLTAAEATKIRNYLNNRYNVY